MFFRIQATRNILKDFTAIVLILNWYARVSTINHRMEGKVLDDVKRFACCGYCILIKKGSLMPLTPSLPCTDIAPKLKRKCSGVADEFIYLS